MTIYLIHDTPSPKMYQLAKSHGPHSVIDMIQTQFEHAQPQHFKRRHSGLHLGHVTPAQDLYIHGHKIPK